MMQYRPITRLSDSPDDQPIQEFLAEYGNEITVAHYREWEQGLLPTWALVIGRDGTLVPSPRGLSEEADFIAPTIKAVRGSTIQRSNVPFLQLYHSDIIDPGEVVVFQFKLNGQVGVKSLRSEVIYTFDARYIRTPWFEPERL